MQKKSLQEKIVKLLAKHPEGLTSIEISKFLGIHRHTATRYIYELIGAGIIHQRAIGAAKLCYLSKKGEKR